MNSGAAESPPRIATSFRDPSGQLLVVEGRVLRIVNSNGAQPLLEFLRSPLYDEFVHEGMMISGEIAEPFGLPDACARILEAAQLDCLAIEHEKVFFPSYPYEWAPRMLAESGLLTLRIARRLLPHKFGLKDATPYNVLFRGAKPTFVDWGSVEIREPSDSLWLPYAQFVKTFVIPLLLEANLGIPLKELLLADRDGIEPESAYRRIPVSKRFCPSLLQFVTLPRVLSTARPARASSIYAPRRVDDPAKARFILTSMWNHLERVLRRLQAREGRRSGWNRYTETRTHYSQKQLEFKQSFVSDALALANPATVLDIGCNTGQFSVMSARAGAAVVSIDSDPEVIQALWKTASEGGLNILPLVVDITRPTPAMGWRNEEARSFLDRAQDRFDMVLLLAVVHHMHVTERIPLAEILSLIADLTRRYAVVELVYPGDPMYDILLRGRGGLYEQLSPLVFESACKGRFQIIRQARIPDLNRIMYLIQRV